jgi:DNA-binding XRE family transcriptional regulator
MDLTPTSIFKNKENRQNRNQNIITFQKAREKCNSQRQAAKSIGVTRSTVQHWEKYQRKRTLDPEVDALFAKEKGSQFLHQLMLAAEFTFSQLGGVGIRLLEIFYAQSQLDQVAACSYGAIQKRLKNMESKLIEFSQQQEQKLVEKMPKDKAITACLDETFPQGIYLVAMDPDSNFIILEEDAAKRDCETWNNALQKRLDALPIKVVQVTSDQAAALVKYTEQCLGAHHSPDLFHVQQDVSKATAFPLKSRIKTATLAAEEASSEVDDLKRTQQASAACPNKPVGRPVDYQARITTAEQEKEQALEQQKKAEGWRDSVRQANRSLGEVYHPFDLNTGKRRTPKNLQRSLNNAFDQIGTNADEANLSENSHKLIEKARRMIDPMVSTLTFFWSFVAAIIASLGLAKELQAVFRNILLPATYIGMCALKAPSAELKHQRLEFSKILFKQLEDNEHWCLLPEDQKTKAIKQARQCASLFQRSSSNVEGRNGQLSLKHHIYKGMGQRKLAALTVVHNYFIRRMDGTTAAERFFEYPPDDLFAWLLKNTDYPAIPAKKRSGARILYAVA